MLTEGQAAGTMSPTEGIFNARFPPHEDAILIRQWNPGINGRQNSLDRRQFARIGISAFTATAGSLAAKFRRHDRPQPWMPRALRRRTKRRTILVPAANNPGLEVPRHRSRHSRSLSSPPDQIDHEGPDSRKLELGIHVLLNHVEHEVVEPRGRPRNQADQQSAPPTETLHQDQCCRRDQYQQEEAALQINPPRILKVSDVGFPVISGRPNSLCCGKPQGDFSTTEIARSRTRLRSSWLTQEG